MPRGKNWLPTVSRQFLTRIYPRPNCLLKCLPNCLSPTVEDIFPLSKLPPRWGQLRDNWETKIVPRQFLPRGIKMPLQALWDRGGSRTVNSGVFSGSQNISEKNSGKGRKIPKSCNALTRAQGKASLLQTVGVISKSCLHDQWGFDVCGHPCNLFEFLENPNLLK